jgi:chromosome segregation ATPase
MMMEEAEKQFSQEGREIMTSKEKLAIGEAIHAMKWLDHRFRGWGLEEECAILENICSNYEKKEIQTNHNYLDLQYQLDDVTKENEQLQKLVEQLRLEIKKSMEELSDYWQVHDEQAREIRQLREETTILRMGEKAANELILHGRAAEERIEELEDDLEITEVEIERLREELTIANIESLAANDIICSKDTRIKELENALVDERTKVIMLIEKLKLIADDPNWQSKGLEHDFDWYITEARKEITISEQEDPNVEEGNYIRDPTSCSIVTIMDANIDTGDHAVETEQMVPNSEYWHITKKRKEAIKLILDIGDPNFNHSTWEEENAARNVLQDMLEEAK